MNIKELRQRTNKTQETIAKELNLQKQTYQNYELGKRKPDIEMVIKLADYFKTTTDEVIGHEIPYQINKSIFTEEQLEIIEEIKTLDKEQCYKILAYIDGLKDGKENRTKTIEKLRSK